jgi:hypothetical protein
MFLGSIYSGSFRFLVAAVVLPDGHAVYVVIGRARRTQNNYTKHRDKQNVAVVVVRYIPGHLLLSEQLLTIFF